MHHAFAICSRPTCATTTAASPSAYDTLCGLLRRSLDDSTRKFEYALAIKDVIVSGDMAVVRLVWTLSATAPGSATTTVTREPGLDVFREQPDGSWKIVRYIAFEEP